MSYTLTPTLATSSDNSQVIIEKTPKLLRIFGTLAASGSYATGGLTWDLTQLFATGNAPPGMLIPSQALPLYVRLWSAKAAASPQTNLFVYNYAPGTTLSNGTLQIFTGAAAQTGLTELSAGSLPSGVTGDVISFEVAIPVP